GDRREGEGCPRGRRRDGHPEVTLFVRKASAPRGRRLLSFRERVRHSGRGCGGCAVPAETSGGAPGNQPEDPAHVEPRRRDQGRRLACNGTIKPPAPERRICL